METIGWGVLGGTARITRRGFLPGLRQARNARLVAVGSRSDSPAALSYDDVLESPAVDAVYVALPNSLHYTWAMKALAAGKHVLCEKPLALSSRDAADIASAANGAGRVVMEAFMYRFHPQYARATWERVLEPVGPLCAAEVHFSEPMNIPGDIREDPDLGGGALWDIGCYCLDLMCWQLGDAISVHSVGVERGGCNWTSATQLRFAGGQLANCWWSFSGPEWQRVTFVGERGTVTLHDPFRPDGRTTMVLEVDGVTMPIIVAGNDCFRAEIEHFGDVVLLGEEPSVSLAGSERWISLAEKVECCLRATSHPDAPAPSC